MKRGKSNHKRREGRKKKKESKYGTTKEKSEYEKQITSLTCLTRAMQTHTNVSAACSLM